MNTLTGRVGSTGGWVVGGGAVGSTMGSGWNYKNIIIAMTTTVDYCINQSLRQATTPG